MGMLMHPASSRALDAIGFVSGLSVCADAGLFALVRRA